jgi:hypothetical protein
MSLQQKTKKLFIILFYLFRHPRQFWRALAPKTPAPRKIFVIFIILLLSFGIYKYLTRPLPTLNADLAKISAVGEKVKEDLQTMPSVALAQTDQGWEVKDDLKDEGIKIENNSENGDGLQIEYPNGKPEDSEPPKKEITLAFPKDYSKPIEVKLDEQRSIFITDNSKEKFSNQILVNEIENSQDSKDAILGNPKMASLEEEPKYLKYSSGRKSIYYSYQKDQALGERKLKNWIVYKKGSGTETESYTFQNARLELDQQGQVKVFFSNGQEKKNQQAMAEVEPSLIERARQVILKDTGQDITAQNQTPDFIIPQAYFLDKNGNQKTIDWKIENENTLKLEISTDPNNYPLALDPTLQFTAPGTSTGTDIITGEGTDNYFGFSLTTGDLNADGKTDLAVGAYGYNSNQGRAYIFLNDGAYPSAAGSADTIITGEGTNNYFGYSLTTGDLNADGKTDLAVGAYGYNSSQGRAYIFLNDGAYPSAAGSADTIITGEGTGNNFGYSLTTGDLNADGKTDLAVGASDYNSSQGRAYIFLNDGAYPSAAGSADTIITGEGTNNFFGISLTTGDLNADGKTDLAVGAYGYNSFQGRAYIFLNDGAYPSAAGSADTIITGEGTNNFFGYSLTTGDLNADGKTDLAVGAYGYNSSQGRAYIFLNDGAYPSAAGSADTIITGEGTNNSFGISLTTGDLNADGKTDLAVGADYYNSSQGRAYIFLNDGAYPSAAGSADTIITGEGTWNSFGSSLTTGDLNADGKTDLAVGAHGYNSSQGRAYIFSSTNGVVNTNRDIEGEGPGNFGSAVATGDLNNDTYPDLVVGAYGKVYIFWANEGYPSAAAEADVIIKQETGDSAFGYSLTTGDLNADGKTDLAVGASDYNSNQGRAYIFLNDGAYPSAAGSADTIITGEGANNYFGSSLTTGDLNADGKTDLAVGAYGYNSNQGRAYIFLNDGAYPSAAGSADTIITGEGTYNYFGSSLTTGDLNADGKTDLAVGAYGYNSSQGRAYIFLNDGAYPSAAGSADTIITGEGTNNYFGSSLTTGDLNADGKTDLAVGAYGYNSSQGRAYIFLNDGAYPSAAGSADTIITGEGTNNYFGYSLTTGDLNADGKTDLAVGAYGYNSYQGRVYIFLNDGAYPSAAGSADTIITGEGTNNYFGSSLTTGDLNADGKTDLAVGAYRYNSYQGRAYIFLNDGAYPSAAGSADTIITGEGTNNYFGYSLTTGDLNADGKTDLAVGADRLQLQPRPRLYFPQRRRLPQRSGFG